MGLLRCPRSGLPLRLDAWERDGADVAYGVLTSEAGRWPVLAGIPVFTGHVESALARFDQRRLDDAVSEAAFGPFPHARGRSQLQALANSGHSGRALASITRRLADRDRRADARVIQAGCDNPMALLEHAYLTSRNATPDAYAYFRYRYSSPRHLVALSVSEALAVEPAPLLDLGCGAGQLTWAFAKRHGEGGVVGLDASFVQLLVGRQFAGDDVQLVCGDATSLPFATGAFRATIAVDVLSFITDKVSAVREAQRVLTRAGLLAVTSVKNALASHVFAGEPLTPSGWAALPEGWQTSVIADEQIVRRYFEGQGMPAADAVDAAAVPGTQLVSLLAARQEPLPDGGILDGQPHARGPLAVNPLYAPVDSEPGSVSYELRFPAGSYRPDNPLMESYLPATFRLSRETLVQARGGRRPEELRQAIAATAVLALPERYPGERWPGL